MGDPDSFEAVLAEEMETMRESFEQKLWSELLIVVLYLRRKALLVFSGRITSSELLIPSFQNHG